MPLLPTAWSELFAVHTPVLELVVRAIALYLCILALLRILPRRTGGEVAHMDLIFMLLIAQGVAPSLGDYASVTEGLIVIGTLVALDYLLNVLSFRIPAVERIMTRRPLEIVREGTTNKRNMAKEFITDDELMTYLRQSGITELSQVKVALIEGKGKVSIIAVDDN